MIENLISKLQNSTYITLETTPSQLPIFDDVITKIISSGAITLAHNTTLVYSTKPSYTLTAIAHSVAGDSARSL